MMPIGQIGVEGRHQGGWQIGARVAGNVGPVTVVQNEVQVKQNISLAVHTSFETSVRYVSETVDEKIWHWDLLESWKNMAFLVFFGLFWLNSSLNLISDLVVSIQC